MSLAKSRSRPELRSAGLTPLGRGLAVLAAFVYFAALTSGVNLLYLVGGMVWAVLVLAFFAGRAQLRNLALEAVLPESVFAGAPFTLRLRVSNRRSRPAFQLAVLTSAAGRKLACLDGGSSTEIELPCVLPFRGRIRVNDLWIESAFPLGLFRRRRRFAGPETVVFPGVREIHGRTASPLVREDTILHPVRGAGDDFIGVRAYDEDEDARLIHWALSAKSGVPVLKQYAQETGNRITLTVGDQDGPGGEERIAEAASLAKFFIDDGADVRLVTPGRTVDFGRGVLHLDVILGTLAVLGAGDSLRDAVPGGRPFPLPAPAAGRPVWLRYAAAATAAAFASFFLIEGLSSGPLLAAALALLGGTVAARLGVRPIPKTVLDAAALLFLFYLLAVDLPSSGIVAAVVHLLSFILVYLVWGAKDPWSLGEMLLTGFLAFLVASSQALSLAYFLLFIVYFTAAASWIHRRQDPDGARSRPVWRKALAGFMARAAALSGLAFVLLPRPFNPGLQGLLAQSGLLRFPSGSRTFGGMTERVELGTWDTLRRNSAPAMRVKIAEESPGARPPLLRVRGAAFDLFDGKRWERTRPEFSFRSGGRSVRARHSAAWFRRERGRLVSPAFDGTLPAGVREFQLYPALNTTLVFTAGPVGAIEAPMPGAFFDANDSLYFSTSYPEGLRYRIVGQAAEPGYSGIIEDYASLVPRFLALPEVDARIPRLAASVTRGRADPLRKAEALESYLRTVFTYSLSSGRGRQTLAEFLFDGRAGNCEYFATAMCLLLRSLGIPSRLAVGFVTDAWSESGGFFDVRQSDAHAWVEALIPGRGWTTFDPTPADGFGGPASLIGQIWSSAAGFFEDLQLRWYRYVVGFDTFTQRDFWLGLIARAGRNAKPVLGVLSALAGLALLIRIRKPRGRVRSGLFRRRLGADAYEDVLRRLARAGLPRPAGQTGREFAAAASARFPELGPLSGLTELRYERKFAGRSPSPERAAAAAAQAADLKAALPRVRRALRRERRRG